MNRNRQGRDRRNYGGGGGDGLLGEGPGMGSLFEPMGNPQVNQLLIAQQLLQQQAALGGAGGYGGDYGGLGDMGGLGGMNYLQQGMGYGGYSNDRKRSGGQSRDSDYKRRRRDSSGRSDRDRSRGRDNNRSSEGKDKNRSNRWDSDKDQEGEEKTGDNYDPAEPTEDDGQSKDKDGNLYCHVCNVSVYDDESFRRHLNGMKHTQRMNSLLTVHQMKSNQLKSRIRAEEHLRKIEGKNSSSDPDFFCKICNNSLTIPWERHRFSNIHKQRQLQVKRGCGWCKVHDFSNFTEVLEHRETEEHKKNADIYGKKRDDRSRIFFYSILQDNSDTEDLDIPEFNAENPVGVKYIIPVTGYFCKLCHKFYNNEKSAKGSHCQSETHYEKFKAATEEKIAAREKRLAEKAAAAEAAALKAKEEEEQLKEDVKDEEMEDTEAASSKQPADDGHDYNDELPLEDVDNEGGLTKEGDYSLGYYGTADQSHNDTHFFLDFSGIILYTNFSNATRRDILFNFHGHSFHFLQHKNILHNARSHYVHCFILASIHDFNYLLSHLDIGWGGGGSFILTHIYLNSYKSLESFGTQDSADVNASSLEDAAIDVSTPAAKDKKDTDEEDTDEDATPTVTPKKARGGTARRGRGRGRARK
ncbi:unnamed protein product [Candidula unifasciata]|uniref:Matrin-type domain-containing protein n=1 Tax=Candidula unifasciata TaxID=100452 RepID=A0A8S4A1E6_9EUPU|nr:unnamed protein product [Candidula unifasciata]